MSASASEKTALTDLPKDWLNAWNAPPAECRPLQIVHGVNDKQANVEFMTALRELGLGGIVCNVSFRDYLVSDANWNTLVNAVEACRKAGLIVWIYDEQGYPSGAAGGHVLKTNPDFEALALAYDPSRPAPFTLRPAYEYTHASNNVYANRRYPNIIDQQAVQCFIDKTHEAYRRRLGRYMGTTVKAAFTDEPSLMAFSLGRLPENARKRTRLIDPVDENVKPLPTVPWVRDLPDLYKKRYGQNLMSVRRNLFAGNTDDDKQVRRQFWELISDLVAERYFGKIQDWCQKNNLASSGHCLCEEELILHVPVEGNALKALGRMDIPGLDVLTSDPAFVLSQGWLTASLPASAAILNGRRKVMTEVSDFSRTIHGQPPVTLPEMQATAAWQAALGVTEFTLYYGSINLILDSEKSDRLPMPPRDYQAYYNFVGRINTLLRDATPAPPVLLYYPIYDLWSEYLPTAERPGLKNQSPRTQQITTSFMNLGRKLVASQIPFALVDHEMLSTAKIRGKQICIADQKVNALILPTGVQLPASAEKIVDKFTAGGGCVRKSDSTNTYPDIDKLQPASDKLVAGHFVRDGRRILLLVNVGKQNYNGRISTKNPKGWSIADPTTGIIKTAGRGEGDGININLPSYKTVLLIGPSSK